MRHLAASAVGSIVLALLVACGPSSRSAGPCTAGQTTCSGNDFQVCQNGQFQTQETCPTACAPTLGCTMCVPGTGTCNGNISHACNADGSGYSDITCDPVQGLSCDQASGVCTGPCMNLGQSYIGCEYYPTVTGNVVGDAFDFAVAISNTSNVVATITIEDGGLTAPMTVMVPANSLVVQKLPWQQDLKLCNAADTPEINGCQGAPVAAPGIVTKGAFHLRSNAPVTVYQFNSLEYSITNGTDFSFSNDASLMLPTNVWRSNYFAAAWQVLGDYPSELAITALQDGTMVMVNSKADTVAATNVPTIPANTPTMLTLNAGDAVELTSITGDFTGSQIQSSAPVQVIGAHFCADIPVGVAACDHLEESMFGVDTLGKTYVINAPAVTSIPTGKVEVVRVVAAEANITLTFDPPQAGAATTLANPGDFIEIPSTADSFLITASGKVLVAQYMEGQDAGGGTGDPAMALAVPVEQFRNSYLFHAPTSYDSNYVDVTAPTGATVTLDGMDVPLTPIGSTGWQLGRVNPLGTGPNADGSHSITGSAPFGITVYGYGTYTSYWYPGGLDLTTVLD